jgi:hypothetical protein
MRNRIACLPACLIMSLWLSAGTAAAQAPRLPPVQLAAGGGFLTSGAYFTGPGALALDNSDAFAGVLQVIVPVHPSVSLVAGGTYARPSWRVSGLPLIGSVGVSGASLWFADAGVRGRIPLGREANRGPTAFAQVGAGLAHYSISTALLGQAVDESATNFAFALGAGLGVPVARRVSLELMAKDYIVSFKSVHDLEPLGIVGRRAHTLVMAMTARLDL